MNLTSKYLTEQLVGISACIGQLRTIESWTHSLHEHDPRLTELRELLYKWQATYEDSLGQLCSIGDISDCSKITSEQRETLSQIAGHLERLEARFDSRLEEKNLKPEERQQIAQNPYMFFSHYLKKYTQDLQARNLTAFREGRTL